MARIRTVKPEFWSNEDLSALPESTHMLAGALLNYVDDEGYFNANSALVKAACFPIREPSVSIPESLRSLQSIGFLELGTCPNGKRYGRIVKFTEHQKVSHPTKSKIAAISIEWDECCEAPEEFRNPPESFRPEGKGKEGKEPAAVASARFQKPTADELTEAFRAKGVSDPEREATKFFDYYESNGWKVGKSKMQSWRHAVGSWCARNFSSQSAPQQQGIQLVSI